MISASNLFSSTVFHFFAEFCHRCAISFRYTTDAIDKRTEREMKRKKNNAHIVLTDLFFFSLLVWFIV